MKENIRKSIFAFLIIVNCIIIFCFSNQVANDTTKTSSRVVDFICEIIPSIKNMQEPDKTNLKEEVIIPIVRKTAHFSIYATLGILTMNFMITYKGRSFYQKGLTSLLFCIAYSISDEVHQLFVIGRSGEIRDVLIDSLGALTGIILVYIITKLYRKLKKKKEDYKLNKDTKVMFISSTGGHFIELMQLKKIMEEVNYQIVTEKTETNKDLKDKYKGKIHFLIYGTRKNKILYPFVLLANCFISLYLYLKTRPQVVITTGTHTAGPMCCIAKILGSKVIYIETFANRNTKTATGTLLYYIADTFVVQWEEMLELYPKAKYWGWIF